jgi:hypothetical protein
MFNQTDAPAPLERRTGTGFGGSADVPDPIASARNALAIFPHRSLGRWRTTDAAPLPRVAITAMRKIEDDGDVLWLVRLEGCERELVLTSNQLLWRGAFDKQTLIQVGRLFAPSSSRDEWCSTVDRALARYVRGEVEQ